MNYGVEPSLKYPAGQQEAKKDTVDVPMIKTRVYKDGALESEDFDPDLVSDYLEDPRSVVLLDMESPSEKELNVLAQEFGLHPLAIEDALHSHQKPKVEKYPNHLFVVLYAAEMRGDTIHMTELDAFVGRQFLITVRNDAAWVLEDALGRWKEGGELATHGVAFLLHGLMDSIVDEYVAISNKLQEEFDDLEESLGELSGRTSFQEDFFSFRKKLVTFRRILIPTDEAVSSMVDGGVLAMHEQIKPYFADVDDHVSRVSHSVEAMVEMLEGTLTLLLSMASNRLNDVMRKVTSWAAIIGVATTIAGIYGMNFKLWPSQENPGSFWIALGMIVGSAVGLFTFFRTKDWI